MRTYEPKYGNHYDVIPDSETNVEQNYREFLMRIPLITVDMQRRGRPHDEQAMPTNKINHHNKENVLFHVLTKDRKTPDGKTMLHIEELQSDWHQKYAKAHKLDKQHGANNLAYSKEDYRQERRDYRAKKRRYDRVMGEKYRLHQEIASTMGQERTQDLYNLLADLNDRAEWLDPNLVPENIKTGKEHRTLQPPLRKSWRLLAFKRLLRFAAENGYDGITWATGEQVGHKYGKVKVYDNIAISMHGLELDYPIRRFDVKYRNSMTQSNERSDTDVSLEELEKLLDSIDSDDVARWRYEMDSRVSDFELYMQRIDENNSYTGEQKNQLRKELIIDYRRQASHLMRDQLTSLRLNTPVVETGKNQFFDMLYNGQMPSEFGKYVKQYDGKVEKIAVEHGRGDIDKPHSATREVHGIKMTPALLKLALHKGQPMFARGINNAPQQQKTAFDDVSLLDRLFRLPFRLLGGVGNDNEWKLGGHGVDKLVNNLGQHYQKWGDNPEGSVTKTFHTLAETVAWGMLERHQTSQEYQARDFAREGEQRTWLRKAMRMLDTMMQSGVNAGEARIMYELISGEINEQDPRLNELSEPVRDTMREIGELAVEYGLISQKSFERYQDKYLHRSYIKYENFDQTRLQRWVDKVVKKRQKKQYGDTLKGRGKFKAEGLQTVIKQVNELNPGWYQSHVRMNNPNLEGVKFKVLEKIRREGKVAKRVYWPDDLTVPDEFSDLTEQPVMAVRAVRGTALYLFREWTREEREQMGEIFDVRYAIARMFHTMSNDLANGHFFKDIAENEEWSIEATPENLANLSWIDPPPRWNTLALSQAEWIKVPGTKIPKSNTFLWGKLGGTINNDTGASEPGYLVRPEIWRDLNELQELNRPTFWRRVMKQFKMNKTTRSPTTHMNNVMSNFVLADLMDVRFEHLYDAVMSMAKHDAIAEEASDMGVFGTSLTEVELREEYLVPLLREIRASTLHTVNQPAEQKTMLLSIIGKVAEQLTRVDNGATRLYQLEDDVFRMALYIKRKELGDSKAQAALAARKQFIDYDIRAPWINIARQTVLPFISYTYRVIPLLGDAFRKRPWKMLKYLTVTWILNQLAYWWDDGDEDEERRALPEQLQGRTVLGIPNAMRLPLRDFWGDPMYLDVSRWVPGEDLVSMHNSHSSMPVPEWLLWGGPLMIAIELGMNQSAFTGQPITNELSDTRDEKAVKSLGHVWQSFMPNIPGVIPGSHGDRRVRRAFADDARQPFSNKPYDLSTELLNSIGIKARGQNTRANQAVQSVLYQRTEREIRAAIKTLERQRLRGDLTNKEFREGIEIQKQHILNLKEKIDKDQGRE